MPASKSIQQTLKRSSSSISLLSFAAWGDRQVERMCGRQKPSSPFLPVHVKDPVGGCVWVMCALYENSSLGKRALCSLAPPPAAGASSMYLITPAWSSACGMVWGSSKCQLGRLTTMVLWNTSKGPGSLSPSLRGTLWKVVDTFLILDYFLILAPWFLLAESMLWSRAARLSTINRVSRSLQR